MKRRILIGLFGFNLLQQSSAHHQQRCLSFLPNAIKHSTSIRQSLPQRAMSNNVDSRTMFSHIIKNPCAEVIVVPVLSDNYAYILVDPDSKESFCVDPAEPRRVLEAAAERNVRLSAAFCTHKHHDHSGGNMELQRLLPGVEVYGSCYESVPGVTKGLSDSEIVKFGNLEVRCVKAACHTVGHMLYYVTNPGKPELQPILFTGDTVFIAGCGRFFEGSADMMVDIMRMLRGYRKDTLVYCGHEYTLRNLEFAKTVDPSDSVVSKLSWTEKVLSMNMPTVPSTLEEEFQYNPFMRAGDLKDAVNATSEVEAMAMLRSMKNRF